MRTTAKIALIAGVAALCAYSPTAAAVVFVTAALGLIASMWANALAEVKAEEQYEEWLEDTEYRVWWNSAVVLGQGYDDDQQ